MKPRILFCTQTAHVLGGFQLWLERMCELLPSRGWDVVVGFAKGTSFHDPARFRQVYRKMEGVDIDGRDGTSEGRILAVQQVCRKVRPDIVIPVLLVDANMAVSRMKYRGSSIRHLYTYQGTHDWNIAEPERYADFIDMCCGCNVLATEVLKERGCFPEERLASVANGVPQRSEPTPRPLVPGVLQLAYAGRIEHPDKRVFDIPGILTRLEEWQVPFYLRIAGSGPQESELKQRLQRFVEAGHVEFMGRLHFNDLQDKVYSRTDILLFPSPWEGWPLVVGEAISAGIVPAAAAFRGVATERFLIPGQNTLMYQVGDTEAAARQIMELAMHPQRLKELSENAYRKSLTQSWERCAAQWDLVLKRTMELPGRIGAVLPAKQSSTHSRMTRLGVPISLQVCLRSLAGRQLKHSDGNAEWPYRDRDFPPADLMQMESDLLKVEQAAVSEWPEPWKFIRSLTRRESQ
jgi:glycosyltransferase involved in cell wall biosynthesis